MPILLLFIKFDLIFGNLFYYSFIFTIPAILVQLLIILQVYHEICGTNWLRLKYLVLAGLLLLTAHISSKDTSIVIIGYYLIWVLWSFYGRRGSLVNDLLFVFMIIYAENPF